MRPRIIEMTGLFVCVEPIRSKRFCLTFEHARGFCRRQQEVIIPADLPLVQELRATLREWAQIWHQLFVVRVHFVMLISLSGFDSAHQGFDANEALCL